MEKRRLFINILVLGLYFFHAISPLLYSAEGGQTEEQPGYQLDVTPAGSLPLTVDQYQQMPAPSLEKDGSSPSVPSTLVLLKKKRILPPSAKYILDVLYLKNAKSFDIDPSLEPVNFSLPFSDESPVCPHGYHLYHSGISPPSA
jgi:hypothetical protein